MKPDLHTRWIAVVLRWGAYGSALLLATGLGWLFLEPDIPIQIGPPIPLAQLTSQVLRGNPYAILQVGILLLLASSPISTLVLGVDSAFRREHTLASVAFGLFVLIGLSLILALR